MIALQILGIIALFIGAIAWAVVVAGAGVAAAIIIAGGDNSTTTTVASVTSVAATGTIEALTTTTAFPIDIGTVIGITVASGAIIVVVMFISAFFEIWFFLVVRACYRMFRDQQNHGKKSIPSHLRLILLNFYPRLLLFQDLQLISKSVFKPREASINRRIR